MACKYPVECKSSFELSPFIPWSHCLILWQKGQLMLILTIDSRGVRQGKGLKKAWSCLLPAVEIAYFCSNERAEGNIWNWLQVVTGVVCGSVRSKVCEGLCIIQSSPAATAAGLGPLAKTVVLVQHHLLVKSLLPASFVPRLLNLNYREAFMMNMNISKMIWEYWLQGSELKCIMRHGSDQLFPIYSCTLGKGSAAGHSSVLGLYFTLFPLNVFFRQNLVAEGCFYPELVFLSEMPTRISTTNTGPD